VLSQKQKISSTEKNPWCFTKGKRHGVSFFSTLSFFVPKNEHPRVAVVVSNKVSSLSTVRHKIKRRFFTAIEKRIGSLPRGLRVVFYVNRGVLDKTYKQIEKGVFGALLMIASGNREGEKKRALVKA
jgi:ribonuclease P protein component